MKKYKFKAKIEAGDAGGAYVLFPYDTEKEFATKGKVPVKATFRSLAAAALARLVSGMLVGVSPADPPVYAAAAAFTVLVTLVSAAIPAWRALRVDPGVALRSQ